MRLASPPETGCGKQKRELLIIKLVEPATLSSPYLLRGTCRIGGAKKKGEPQAMLIAARK